MPSGWGRRYTSPDESTGTRKGTIAPSRCSSGVTSDDHSNFARRVAAGAREAPEPRHGGVDIFVMFVQMVFIVADHFWQPPLLCLFLHCCCASADAAAISAAAAAAAAAVAVAVTLPWTCVWTCVWSCEWSCVWTGAWASVQTGL